MMLNEHGLFSLRSHSEVRALLQTIRVVSEVSFFTDFVYRRLFSQSVSHPASKSQAWEADEVLFALAETLKKKSAEIVCICKLDWQSQANESNILSDL